MARQRPSKQAQLAADRERIRKADAIGFLDDVVAGKRLVIRDENGRVIGFTPPAELPLRVSAATTLLKKIVPDLAAQQVEVSGGTENTFTLVLSSGMAPPGSDAKLVEDNPDQIEHKTPAPDTLVSGTDQAAPGEATGTPAASGVAENTQAATDPQAAPAPEANDTRAARRRRRWNPEDTT